MATDRRGGRSAAAAAALRPLALLAALAAARAGEVPEWHSVETAFGALRVREFGPHDGPLVLCFHGMMDNDFIREEWNPTAFRLADDGYHVVLPDFHSGPEVLRPGTLTGNTVRALVTDLALHLDGFVPARYRAAAPPRVAVLGKSWGARMAAEAGSLPEVVAVALVVPAFSEEDAAKLLPPITAEVALLMVRDDDVAPIARATAYRQLLGGREAWVEAESGGHKILQEFVAPIAEFVGRFRERFSHGGEETAALYLEPDVSSSLPPPPVTTSLETATFTDMFLTH